MHWADPWSTTSKVSKTRPLLTDSLKKWFTSSKGFCSRRDLTSALTRTPPAAAEQARYANSACDCADSFLLAPCEGFAALLMRLGCTKVRLLGSVRHRLRLLTSPMRAGGGKAVPVPASDAIPFHVKWPSTPAGRQCLA